MKILTYFSAALIVLFHSCFSMLAGTVVAWGDPSNLQTNVPADMTNVVSIGTGDGYGLALTEIGTVRSWGNDYAGAGPVPAGLSNVIAIASGANHSLALKKDGTITAWKNFFDDYGQSVVPIGLSNVVSIAAGSYHSLALKADGTVKAWGRNDSPLINHGQSMVPPGLSNVIAIAGGGSHSLALRADGTVAFWGSRYWSDEPFTSSLSNVMAIAAGGYHSLALMKNGTVAAWGSNSAGQTNVPAGLTNVVAIACGWAHSLALKADGTITAWGYNAYGQTNAPNSTNAMALSGGGTFSAAIYGEGNLKIFQNPVSRIVVAGDSVVFQCGVIGRPKILSQWHFDGTPISAQTNTTLAILNVNPTHAGSYYFSASNTLGDAQSSPAILSVLPLAFESQPTNMALYGGDSANLEVRVRNLGPFSFQWQLEGSEIRSATNATLSLTNATVSQAGNYAVIASNIYGSATSSIATIEVIPVSILTQPTNRTIFSGATTVFSVSPWKNGPFTYQWRHEGIDLFGQTNQMLSLTNVTTNHAGVYSVVVSNLYGFAESSNAVLTVVESPPIITSQPTNQFAWFLGNTSFRVDATGSAPLTYQWFQNGAEILNATNAILLQNRTTTNEAGIYSVVVSNAFGVVTSSNALHTVVPVARWGSSIGAPPQGLTNLAGIYSTPNSSQVFWLRNDGTAVAMGSAQCPPLLQVGVSNISTLATSPARTAAVLSNGVVSVWGCGISGVSNLFRITNAVAAAYAYSVPSEFLILKSDGTITNSGSLPAAPNNLKSVVQLSSGIDFSLALKIDGTLVSWGSAQQSVPSGVSNVVAISCGPYHSLALQADGTVASWGSSSSWENVGQTNVPPGLSNIIAIAAASNRSLALKADGTVVAWGSGSGTNVPSGLSNVWAIAGGDSSYAIVSDGRTMIARNPIGTTVLKGTRAMLSVGVSSPVPVSYQWQHNGQDITDATNALLVLPSIDSAHNGSYRVAVSNGSETIWSKVAQLTVVAPPEILVQPSNQSVEATQTATFSVVAEGTPPLYYQWRKIGNIPNANSSSLVLTNLHRANGGNYSVFISNAFGSAISTQALLHVMTPQQLGQPTILPDGNFSFSSQDNDGGVLTTNDLNYFELETSTNLSIWEKITNEILMTNGVLLFQDSITNSAQRFYRVRETP